MTEKPSVQPGQKHPVTTPNSSATSSPPDKHTLRTRVNHKLLVGTVAVVAVVTLLSFFSRNYFLTRNAKFYLELARRAEAADDPALAVRHYGHYLQLTEELNADNPAAQLEQSKVLFHMGELLEPSAKTGNELQRVVFLYEKALRFDPEAHDTQRKLVPLLTRFGRATDALHHIAQLEPHATSVEDAAELAFRAGECHEQLNRWAEAQKRYAQSLAKLPNQMASYLALARIWAAKPDEATLKIDNGEERWKRLEQLNESLAANTAPPALRAIVLLLDEMVLSQTGPAAQLTRARMLGGITLKSEVAPALDAGVAAKRAQLLMDSVDLDKNGTIEGEELWNAAVPALADADGNGVLTRDELAARLVFGDRQARLNAAERALEEIIRAAPPEANRVHSEALLALIELLQEKANAREVAEIQRRREQLERVRDLASQGLKLNDPDPRFQLVLAEQELNDLRGEEPGAERDRHLDAAEAYLRAGLETVSSADAASFEGDLWKNAWDTADPVAAEVRLHFALAQLLVARASSNPDLAAKYRPGADASIARLRELSADPRLAMLLELQVLLLDGRTSDALVLANRLQGSVGSPSPISREIATLLGGMYLRVGNPDAAQNIFRTQLKMDPLWTPGLIATAENLAAANRLPEAIDAYQKVLGVPGVAERLLKLAMLQQAQRPAERRDWRMAEAALSIAEQSRTDGIHHLVLKSQLNGVKAVTFAELGQERADPRELQKAVQILESEESALRTALEAHPETVELWTALAETLLRRADRQPGERRKQALELIAQAREKTGPNAELSFFELSLMLQQPRETALPFVQQLARDIGTLPVAGRQRLAYGVSEALQLYGEAAAARQVLQEQIARDPRDDDLESYRRLLQSLLQSLPKDQDEDWNKQWTEALAQVEKLEGSTDGTSSLVRAQRILVQPVAEGGPPRDLATARLLLQTAARTRPYSATVARARGMLEELTGNLDAAMTAYQDALSLGDSSSALITHLVALYHQNGRNDDADRLLRDVEEQHSRLITGDLARLALSVAHSKAQDEKVLAYAEQLVRETGSDQDKLMQALLQLKNGKQSEQILKNLRRAAYELAPKNGRTWAALVYYLGNTQAWQEAEETIEAAGRHIATQPTAESMLTVAQLWEILCSFHGEKESDHRAAATRAYDAALKDFGADVRVRMMTADHYLRIKDVAKAAPIINGLRDPQANVPKEARNWAVQQQAMLEGRSGTHVDTRKALAALQAARSEGVDQSDVNLRLQLQLLQRLVEVDTRAEQREVYQALLDAGKLTPLDQLRYADLLDSLGAWEEASAQYVAHLTALPDSIPGRLAYCYALLRHLPDGSEVRDLLTRELSAVERKEPNSTRTTLLRARFLAATDQKDEATQLVTALIDPRFTEQGEAKYRRFVQQENAVEFFQTLLQSAARSEPLTADALTEASKLVRRGDLDAAAKLIAASPVASFVDQALHSTLQQSIRTLEEWNPAAAESYLQKQLASSAPRDGALELAKHLVRQKKMDEALKLCDAQWDQITPAGVAFVVSVIARSADDRQLAELKVWRDRLAASADALKPAEQAHLYTFLGDYDNLTRDYDSAVVQYHKALAADRTRYVPLNNAAFLQARRGKDLDEAAAAIGEAIQIAGPRRELVDTRATVLMAKDQLIEARDELQQFVARSSDPATLFRLAECHYKLRDTAQAKTTLDTALANGLDAKRLHPLDQELLEKMQRDLR